MKGESYLIRIMVMEIFDNEIKNVVNNLVEEKLSVLKENTDFSKKSSRLSDAMEELEQTLSKEQKDLFNEIVNLFYETEKYYFTLCYSLGVIYGKDLK